MVGSQSCTAPEPSDGQELKRSIKPPLCVEEAQPNLAACGHGEMIQLPNSQQGSESKGSYTQPDVQEVISQRTLPGKSTISPLTETPVLGSTMVMNAETNSRNDKLKEQLDVLPVELGSSTTCSSSDIPVSCLLSGPSMQGHKIIDCKSAGRSVGCEEYSQAQKCCSPEISKEVGTSTSSRNADVMRREAVEEVPHETQLIGGRCIQNKPVPSNSECAQHKLPHKPQEELSKNSTSVPDLAQPIEESRHDGESAMLGRSVNGLDSIGQSDDESTHYSRDPECHSRPHCDDTIKTAGGKKEKMLNCPESFLVEQIKAMSMIRHICVQEFRFISETWHCLISTCGCLGVMLVWHSNTIAGGPLLRSGNVPVQSSGRSLLQVDRWVDWDLESGDVCSWPKTPDSATEDQVHYPEIAEARHCSTRHPPCASNESSECSNPMQKPGWKRQGIGMQLLLICLTVSPFS